MSNNKLNDLREIFCKTFPDAKIPEKIDKLQVGDFDEWDSLGNFNLLLAIEEFYNIKFDVEQMSNIKSVPDILANIEDFKKC